MLLRVWNLPMRQSRECDARWEPQSCGQLKAGYDRRSKTGPVESSRLVASSEQVSTPGGRFLVVHLARSPVRSESGGGSGPKLWCQEARLNGKLLEIFKDCQLMLLKFWLVHFIDSFFQNTSIVPGEERPVLSNACLEGALCILASARAESCHFVMDQSCPRC